MVASAHEDAVWSKLALSAVLLALVQANGLVAMLFFVPPVRSALNTLSRAGSLLEEGDRSAVADLLGDANWVGRFKDAAQRVSTGADLDAAYKGLGDLSSAARSGGDVKAIKSTYVVAVSALERWARSAGVNKAVSGL